MADQPLIAAVTVKLATRSKAPITANNLLWSRAAE